MLVRFDEVVVFSSLARVSLPVGIRDRQCNQACRESEQGMPRANDVDGFRKANHLLGLFVPVSKLGSRVISLFRKPCIYEQTRKQKRSFGIHPKLRNYSSKQFEMGEL